MRTRAYPCTEQRLTKQSAKECSGAETSDFNSHFERPGGPEAGSSGLLERCSGAEARSISHFERSGGSEARSSSHFERSGGSKARSSSHFEDPGDTKARSSGHFERPGGSEARPSGQYGAYAATAGVFERPVERHMRICGNCRCFRAPRRAAYAQMR